MNKGWSEHASAYPRCKGRLIFNFPAEEQKGVCTRQQLKCNTCNYKSKTHNLYTETDTHTWVDVQHSLISHCMWVSQNCLQVQLEPCTVSLAPATPHLGVDVGDFGPADRVPELPLMVTGARSRCLETGGGRGREGRSHARQGRSKPTAQLPAAVPSFVPPLAQPGASRVDHTRWLNHQERSRLTTGTQLLQTGRPGRGLGKSTLLLRAYLGRQYLEFRLFSLQLRLSRRLQRWYPSSRWPRRGRHRRRCRPGLLRALPAHHRRHAGR